MSHRRQSLASPGQVHPRVCREMSAQNKMNYKVNAGCMYANPQVPRGYYIPLHLLGAQEVQAHIPGSSLPVPDGVPITVLHTPPHFL